MDQIVWQRRSESAWREIVARQEQSGLTVQDFCERKGLKAASLYGWRVRLRQEPAGKGASPQISPSARAKKPPSSSLIWGPSILAGAASKCD